ncbi:BA14K family protein [Xanthobacter sp. TB0139]|uniref:BA14K family protein n=1 Tax=Xanthobacter sp. TB0139 TaxID=3459178 RepID=UPI004039D5FE
MLRKTSRMSVGQGVAHGATARATPRKPLVWAVIGTLCASSLGMVAPVQAQSLNVAASSMATPLAQAGHAAVEQVQWRHQGPEWGRGHGWRPPPPPRGRGGWRRPPPPPPHAHWGNPYWRNGGWYYRNNNNGAWVAAGIAGLALGAAAAAAMNNRNDGPVYVNPPADADAVAYCARKFRSYNPRTGTYTGYDGLQHPCP